MTTTQQGLQDLLKNMKEDDPMRWEIGFRNIVQLIMDNQTDFDIKNVVAEVEKRLTPKQVESKNVLVLVEAQQGYLMRYVVQTPKDHPEWALDTVTCEEAVEFSQKSIGETILSHRVISEEEFHALFDNDNSYLRSWSPTDRKKLVTVINPDGTLTNPAKK